jgi:glutamyl-tRNA synthetase
MDAEARSAIESAGARFFFTAAESAKRFASGAASADGEALLAALRAGAGVKGAGFFKPLRAALTGQLHGPELAPLLAAMPIERVTARLAAHAGH